MRNQFDKTEPRYNGRPSKAMLSEFAHNKIMKEFTCGIGHKNKYDNDQHSHPIDIISPANYPAYVKKRREGNLIPA